MEYTTERVPNFDALQKLYSDVSWTAYTDANVLEHILDKTLWFEACYQDDELIALIRVVGDDASIAYIQDILVLEAYQHKGIGSRLIQDALERFSHVRQIVLSTDNTEKTKAFYTSCGFKAVEELGALAFMRINEQ